MMGRYRQHDYLPRLKVDRLAMALGGYLCMYPDSFLFLSGLTKRIDK